MTLLTDGQDIRGTYVVERFLGEGAFAEVYRVRHRFLGRQAMKVFKVVGMTMAETEDTLGEAAMLSRIGHPNIIRVFDADVIETSRGRRGFFTMEYVAGGSLDQFWKSHGARLVPVDVAVDILAQVCRGLAVAHGENPPIVHRDIKPQNILVGYDGAGLRARISDFGLAKRVNPLTMLATTRGTFAFKAPEALRDFKTDSCAGDVWALGTTLYLLLTDRLPYPEESDNERFQHPVIPPSRLNVHVDTRLDQIVIRALSVEATSRYQSAQQLLADLSLWRPRNLAASFTTATQSSATAKSVLGANSPANEQQARTMVSKALQLSKNAGQLIEAADLLEEALNKSPQLREEYESRLKRWRCGVAM